MSHAYSPCPLQISQCLQMCYRFGLGRKIRCTKTQTVMATVTDGFRFSGGLGHPLSTHTRLPCPRFRSAALLILYGIALAGSQAQCRTVPFSCLHTVSALDNRYCIQYRLSAWPPLPKPAAIHNGAFLPKKKKLPSCER